MEYAIPESEWRVVIKYVYEKSEEDKKNSAAHAKAMADLKPLGHHKILGNKGKPGWDRDIEDGNESEEE